MSNFPDPTARAARLAMAQDAGLNLVPGMIVLHPRAGDVLDIDAPRVVTPHAVDAAFFPGATRDLPPDAPGALVCLPRSRDAARDLIAQAVDACRPGAPVVVDGQKTDGIDALLKALRGRVDLSPAVSKAHGKIAWFAARPGALADWRAGAATIHAEGRDWHIAPGVFSADAVDPASRLLADSLPSLSGAGADLGAGWGYLAAHVLAGPGVTALHLVEEDARALDCARLNVADPRAQFHWADARNMALSGLDFVVMNPPFHQGRTAEPALGMAFIRAAAGMLRGSGRLWMVANRHLPYEPALAQVFAQVTETGGDSRFKLLTATQPRTRGQLKR
jgi:16S rRNA (guanine1207-N2)-methyltransferase